MNSMDEPRTDIAQGWETLFESEELLEVLDLLREPGLVGQVAMPDFEKDDPRLFQRVECKVRNKLKGGYYHAA